MFLIKKPEFQSLINKYYLNGLIESVEWNIENKNLNIKITSPNREMVGIISHNNFNLCDSNIGIFNTSQLNKLISIMNNDVYLDLTKHGNIYSKLNIFDDQFNVSYTLADTITIPKAGKYNGPEEYNLKTILNKEIIQSLIKAKSALDDSSTVMIKCNSDIELSSEYSLELIFGGDIEYSNKVSYFIKDNLSTINLSESFIDPMSDFKLGFNSDLFKEILNVNKDAESAYMDINLEGLLKLSFNVGNISSTYYIVKKDV